MRTFRNDGARLLAAELDRREVSQGQAERDLDVSAGVVSRLLSGDRLPGRTLGLRIRDTYGVPLEAWDVAAEGVEAAAVGGE